MYSRAEQISREAKVSGLMSVKTWISVLVLFFAIQVPANVVTWNSAGGGGTNWSINANWNPNTGDPNATTATALFDTNTVNPNLDSNRTVSNVLFTANAPSLTLKGSSTLILAPDSQGNVGILNNSPNTQTINFNISNSSVNTVIATTGGDLILNGNLTPDGTISFAPSSSSQTIFVNGSIVGATKIVKAAGNTGIGNAGALVLAGNNSTFTGDVQVNNGTLYLASSNALGTAGTLTMAAAANALSPSVFLTTGGLTNSRPVALNSGNTGVITVGGTNASGTTTWAGTINLFTNTGPSHDLVVSADSGGIVKFSGIISEGSTAANISKTNGGTVIFAVSNKYSGTTTLNMGTLESQNANSLGTGNVVLNAGTLVISTVDQNMKQTFTLNGTATNNVASGITFTLGDAANDITGAGKLVKSGAGILTISNANNNTGGVSLNAGRIEIVNNNSLGTGTLTLNGGELYNAPNLVISNDLNVTASSSIIGTNGADTGFASKNITGTAGVTLFMSNVGPSNTRLVRFFSNDFVFASDIQFDDNSRVRFANNAGTNTLTGVIKGTGITNVDLEGIHMNASGALILSNNNSYTSTTVVDSGGTIIIASANALGSASGKTMVSNASTLAISGGITYNTAEPVFIMGSGVSGQGAFNNIGGTNTFAGIFTLNGNSTIGTAIDKLTVSGDITIGSNFLTVTNSGSSTLVLSGIVGAGSGSGGLVHNGTGTLTLSGNNAFTGSVTNQAGTLEVNHANALGTGAKNLSVSGGTLLFNLGVTNTSATVQLSGGALAQSDMNVSLGQLQVLSSSSINLAKDGTDGRFTFAGATNVGGGTLTITGWSGDESGGDGDLIFFTSSSTITSSFINNVSFAGYYAGARVLATGELVPITPEPGSIMTGVFLVGMLLRRFRDARFKSSFESERL